MRLQVYRFDHTFKVERLSTARWPERVAKCELPKRKTTCLRGRAKVVFLSASPPSALRRYQSTWSCPRPLWLPLPSKACIGLSRERQARIRQWRCSPCHTRERYLPPLLPPSCVSYVSSFRVYTRGLTTPIEKNKTKKRNFLFQHNQHSRTR